MTPGPAHESTEGGTIVDGEHRVLELIATGAGLEDVLDALCRIIDEQSGLRSSIFLLDGNGERLILAAAPQLPEVWRRLVASFPITATACGAAITRRQQIVSPDISIDPSYAGYQDGAKAAGLRGVWSTPFFSEHGNPLGTFAVYRSVPGLPDAAQLRLVDRATRLASVAVERHQMEEALREGERLLRVVLDTLPVGVAVVDSASDIVLNNPASQRIWSELIPSGPERYARSKGWWHDTGRAVQPEEWGSARALASGECVLNEVIEIEALDGVRKVIQNSAVPIRDGGGRITGAVIVNEDISARNKAERELHDSLTQMHTLTGRLMRAQDDERRRIAQILHETTAQDLAALKMHLTRLTRTQAGLSDDDRAALAESTELAERSMTGIRTLSYLLHPPFLDEAGLLSALRWYAGGFAERSGIRVDLDFPPTLERLAQDVETALFRVVQEALINIHHHAASPTAMIRLRVSRRQLTLEIEDQGRGLPPELIAQLPTGGGALGVGVAGMRARLQQLGGTLDITSHDSGTVVRAYIPLASVEP